MGRISVFNHVTLDGFYAGPRGEIDWFKDVHDDEWDRYAWEHATRARNTLMFGRTTYDMMKSWWPTPAAREMAPEMAEVMNTRPKIVFSSSLGSAEDEPHWKNVRVTPRLDAANLKRLKAREDVTILGSGTIVQQLAHLGLIDEYTLVVVPVVLGKGKPLFEGVSETHLRLIEARAFGNGVALLRYEA